MFSFVNYCVSKKVAGATSVFDSEQNALIGADGRPPFSAVKSVTNVFYFEQITIINGLISRVLTVEYRFCELLCWQKSSRCNTCI